MSSYNQTFAGKLKTDSVLEHGAKLDWKVEESEFSEFTSVGGYQTADEVDEDAYPDPACRYRVVVGKPGQSVEETYYWFLNFLRNDLNFPQIDKIYDVFSASESSALWGSIGQRQAIQQDRASQYLRGIGELIRTLFQIVRELRILDERLEPYSKWKENKSADITLKGIFANLVEGGGNNPDSIYSLAAKVGFTVLPDLFFNTHVYELDKIDKEVDEGSAKEFNNVIKTVLKRKLFGYINWKEKTEKEFTARRKFQIQYLRQHWNTIKLYMTWIKPYLRANKRLTARENHINSADFIGAFDTSRIEIEILAKTPYKKTKTNAHYSCVLATFSFKSKPTLTYKPEMQQQVVGHSGVCEVTLRSYGWHEDDIIAYKKMRQEEDIELLKLADESVASAFDALKEELQKYLDEAEASDLNNIKKREEEQKITDAKAEKELYEKRKKESKKLMFEPFIGIFAGFGELGKSFFSVPKINKPKDDVKLPVEKDKLDKDAKKDAAKRASGTMWVAYNVFKKTNRLLNW